LRRCRFRGGGVGGQAPIQSVEVIHFISLFFKYCSKCEEEEKDVEKRKWVDSKKDIEMELVNHFNRDYNLQSGFARQRLMR